MLPPTGQRQPRFSVRPTRLDVDEILLNIICKHLTMSLSANKDHIEKELAKWLHEIREEKGISQEVLGIQLGKGQSDLGNSGQHGDFQKTKMRF